MPSALTLVIYVSAAVAADPNTVTLQRAAQEILGDQAQVTLRASAGAVPDEALSAEGALADGVADVAWQSDEHRRATVRCYVAKLHRVVKRDVSFEEDSDPGERERMLGFVVASMLLPEPEPEAAEPPTTPQAQPPKRESLPESVPEPLVEPEHFVGMLELLGMGASGAGSAYGAGLGARWFFARALSLRFAAGLRSGQLAAANANTRVEFAGFGLGVTVPLGARSRFALGGHAGPLLLRQEATRLSASTGAQERKSRLIFGADGCFEGSLRFSGSAAFVAGVGAELAFGRTALLVKGNQVAEIPALHGIAELGIQAQF